MTQFALFFPTGLLMPIHAIRFGSNQNRRANHHLTRTLSETELTLEFIIP